MNQKRIHQEREESNGIDSDSADGITFDYNRITKKSKWIKLNIDNSFSTLNTAKKKQELELSPVLRKKVNESRSVESPILNKTVYFDKSPVIGISKHRTENQSIYLARPRKLDKVHITPVKSCNISPSKSEYSIHSYSSSSSSQPIFASLNSQSEENLWNIEAVSTQEIQSVSVCDTEDSSSSCYFHVPKSNNKYLKGGFASQAINSLRKQKTNADIFKHVLYLSNIGKQEFCCLNMELVRKFQVLDVRLEFSCTIAVCADEHGEKSMVMLNEEFVCLSAITIFSISLKLYAPYVVKRITYDNSDIDFYVNVSKVTVTEE